MTLRTLGTLTVSMTLFAAAVQAVDRVPFDEVRRVTLPRTANESVLAVGGYFESPVRLFEWRTLLITVNGQFIADRDLLSPRQWLAPRAPRWPVRPRIVEETHAITFPFTHRSGGLADYRWEDRQEYDKWGRLFNDFPQTIYIDLRELAADGDDTLEIAFYNTVDGAKRIDDDVVKPPFVITELSLHASRPPSDDFGPYVVPVWAIMDRHPEMSRRAMERLADPATAENIRAQILAQSGMLNLMKGHHAAALDLFRRAIKISRDFPEHNEICYRLLHATGKPPVPMLPETNDNPGSWAALFNDTVALRAGQPVDRQVQVPWLSDAPAADAGPQAPASAIWHPIAEQINGPEPPPDMPPNEFAIAYTATELLLWVRGPVSEIQNRDFPGTDRPAWEFNCVEFFLAPRAAFTRCYELNVTAANGRFDQRNLWHSAADPGQEFNGTWQSRTAIEDGLLHVAYRIPWSDFGFHTAPEPDDVWVANIIRVQFTRDAEGSPVHREFTAGKLLWRYFHRIQDGLFFTFAPRS